MITNTADRSKENNCLDFRLFLGIDEQTTVAVFRTMSKNQHPFSSRLVLDKIFELSMGVF